MSVGDRAGGRPGDDDAHVTPQEYGELQGAIGSIRGLATLFGPGIFTTAFAIGIAHGLPGAAWYLGAALLVFAVVPVLRDASADESAGVRSSAAA